MLAEAGVVEMMVEPSTPSGAGTIEVTVVPATSGEPAALAVGAESEATVGAVEVTVEAPTPAEAGTVEARAEPAASGKPGPPADGAEGVGDAMEGLEGISETVEATGVVGAADAENSSLAATPGADGNGSTETTPDATEADSPVEVTGAAGTVTVVVTTDASWGPGAVGTAETLNGTDPAAAPEKSNENAPYPVTVSSVSLSTDSEIMIVGWTAGTKVLAALAALLELPSTDVTAVTARGRSEETCDVSIEAVDDPLFVTKTEGEELKPAP